ncbi:MAG: hypothetical protein GY861_25145 [bacterium]|nr:hypothetical protein [bacterium]
MKYFTLQTSEGNFIIAKFPNIRLRWNNTIKDVTTDDLMRGKHYKSKAGAERGLAGVIKNTTTKLTHLKTSLRTKSMGGYYLKKSITDNENLLDLLNGLTIAEVEIDPEDKKKPKIRFKDARDSYMGFKGYEKGNSAQSYCCICGLILKDLPYFSLGGSWKKKLNVCPLCLMEHAHEGEVLLNKMDKVTRKELESERFLHKLD